MIEEIERVVLEDSILHLLKVRFLSSNQEYLEETARMIADIAEEHRNE